MARRKEELTLNYRKLYGTHSVNFCSKSIKKSLNFIRRSHPGSNTLSSLTKKSYLDAYCIKPKVWSNQRLPEGWENNVHVRSGIFQLSKHDGVLRALLTCTPSALPSKSEQLVLLFLSLHDCF